MCVLIYIYIYICVCLHIDICLCIVLFNLFIYLFIYFPIYTESPPIRHQSPNHNRPSGASTTLRPRTCFSMAAPTKDVPGRWAPKPPARAIGLDGSDLVTQGTNGTVNAMTPRHEVNKFCKSHS